MKKFKLIDEVGWMLTDEAKADKNLNAVDKNMLAILQFIEDGKATHSEWFRILIKHPKGKWDDDEYNSIEKYFSDFEIPTAYCTLNRSVNKLLRLGYIDYITGWYNNTTHQGMTPMIKLLKGTIPIRCSDIATAKGNDEVTVNSEQFVNNAKLITDKSATCSNIAIAYEKEKEKENNKHTYNLSTLVDKSITSDISTSIEETNPLFKVLMDCDDENDNLQAFLYLDENYTNDNLEYIRKWWRNKADWLVELDRFCRRKA